MADRTRIIVADDHKIFREGLRLLLEREGDIEVVAEAADGRDAVRLTRELEPDVVVMDITMPGLNGIDATRLIKRASRRTKVVVLSIHSSAEIVRDAMCAGASACIAKENAFDDLGRAIRCARSGKGMPDRFTGAAARRCKGRPGPVLSPREREVLQVLAEGRTTREIARLLHISVKTVDTHRMHIMEKLGINSLPGLTKYAIRNGLTSLDS